VLRKIFGGRTKEVTGGWRKLQSEERFSISTHCLYNYNEQMKENNMGRACGTYSAADKGRVFEKTPLGKESLGKHRLD
jgi:hypothetical protein